MMNKNPRLYKLFGIFFGISLVNFPTSVYAQEAGLNFISEIKGSVEVQSNGKGKYEKVYIGETVNPSDKLRLKKGAFVKVMCDNLSLEPMNSQGEFPISKICKSTKTPIFREDVSTDNSRGLNNLNIPYLISPRNTAILNKQPTLRWNPVSGATSYQVQISSGEAFNWTTTANQPTVIYSEEPMQTGIYKVNITANNGASTKDKDDSVFFIVQSKENINQVNAYVEKLQQMSLSNSSRDFALAHLYKSYDFNAKAIELLEELVKDGNQTTAVYQLLGSIYKKIGLNDLARENYSNAMQSAKTEGNLKAQKNIQSELDRILSNP